MSIGTFNSVGGYENFVPPPPPVYYGIELLSTTVGDNNRFYTRTNYLPSSVDTFTFEFFIKNNMDLGATSTKDYSIIYHSGINKFVASIKGGFVATNKKSNVLEYKVGGTGVYESNRGLDFSGGTVKTTKWHHVAFIYGGTFPMCNLYIDGKSVTKNLGTPVHPSTDFYTIYGGGSTITSWIYGDPTHYYAMANNVGLPLYGVRFTLKTVYTGNFTVPITFNTSQTNMGTNIADITDECVFCLESYKQGSTTVIRDAVTNTDLTPKLRIATYNSVQQVAPTQNYLA